MRRLGLRTTKRIARGFNEVHSGQIALRKRMLEEKGPEWLPPEGDRLKVDDGFVVDASRSLPHLDELLEAGNRIVSRYGEEFGGEAWDWKPFLQNILPEDELERHPAFLDFATSPELISAIAEIFGYLPQLSGLPPTGVRVMESSTRFDPTPEGPWRSSQLYHLDYHSTPTVYVLVALKDTAPDDGPFTFLGAAASKRVVAGIDYGRRGVPYRLEDDEVMAHVSSDEVNEFSVPAGTVLIVESSACFHFGSRCPASDRYQVQYAFTSPVRDDFAELWTAEQLYPQSADDPPLRRAVLDRDPSTLRTLIDQA